MARGRKKLKPAFVPHTDATPERLSKGDDWEMINPAEIDDAEQRNVLTRRFRSSTLDRLHRNGRLTWAQWYAGDQYRNAYHRAAFLLKVVASYGERTTGGESSYGLPRTEAQLRARNFVKQCREQIPFEMRGFMDRLLVHDEMPKYGGRAAMRNLTQIRFALDCLAFWMRLT